MVRASFVERPNRFLVRCRSDEGREIEAQLPNPGRLSELLLPGAALYLEQLPPDALLKGTRRSRMSDPAKLRKTQHTVWAVEREGEPILLHTQHTNKVARHLLENCQIKSLESARVVRSEVPVGRSRFDFLMEEPEGQFFLEVKSVTLFGNGAARFPDAITDRGRHHLLQLADIGKQALLNGKPKPVVLFLVHSQRVNRFLPDYHTDYAFSQTFLEVRDYVRFRAVSVGWTESLQLKESIRELSIPWEVLNREVSDRGAYLLLLKIGVPSRITVGQLGEIDFDPGWYVYVGSARKALNARVARHLRKRKRFHWHIDFLRDKAHNVYALPIRSSRDHECSLAENLNGLLAPHSPGFGSSDCSCSTHLFFSPDEPTRNRRFHEILDLFRVPAE